ncbi:YhgE/Pip C-terminal domain protein [Streptococcus ictaluri 707-05]|uniref:YhgE/Pip C-terminal domain protein n=1 Tax=Streptococcus ictaluri 707-05 TaxID=764299 RepID=G5K0P7_9STRE|nr:YhgE/Pip C-terminal domain protein [Streptococcus ictaluri 707-05]
MTPEQQNELSSALTSQTSNATLAAKEILTNLQMIKEGLTSLSTQDATAPFVTLKESVAQIASQSNQALPASSTALLELSQGLTKVHTGLSDQALPATHQLANGLVQLDGKNEAVLSGISNLSNGASQLNNHTGQLLSGNKQLLEGSHQLSGASIQLADGSQSLTSGLTALSTGLTELDHSLSKASQQLSLISVTKDNAKKVAKPLTLSKSDTDKVKTNGIAMAPYMIAVSLMVVALSTNVIFANSLSGRPVNSKWDWAKQKLVINGFISTVSSFILYFAIQLLGFEANHSIKTLAFIVLSGWTLMALVTALVGWDDRYGSFASLIMLLLQVGASGGSYPIELSGAFFRYLHPFLPMSYIVSGLRQTISLRGHIGTEVSILTGFLIAFMLIGLVIYRPKSNA